MFLEYFKITSIGVGQILLLAAIGYLLVRKNLLGPEGLSALSRLVIEVTLPVLIFCELIRDFRFDLYPDWWTFPILSIIITGAGLLIGWLLSLFIKGEGYKLQFRGLVAFQNSGYLPLSLVAAILAGERLDTMFIYIFLLLLGFNILMWSLGVHMLAFSKTKSFELGSLFSPPVIATILSLVLIYFGLYRFVPEVLIKPLSAVGNCTIPLALFVVGGNLAQINLGRIRKKEIFLMSIAKMILLPLLGLWLTILLKLPELIGLLIIIQLAMPPATSLSVIINHYKKEDLLISQGVFFGHIISIITIPVFLSLYFTLVMLK